MKTRANWKEPDLGYRFMPGKYPNMAGHPRLEILISPTPSERHFDPEAVQLLVFSQATRLHPPRIDHLTVHHPWPYENLYKVAPGTLIISDRKGKKVEAFTFGGRMLVEVEDESTKSIIESDAPILELDLIEKHVMQLVEEVEIIFAKRRAIWAHDEPEYETRLAKIPPLQLYAACLEEIISQFKHDYDGDAPDIYAFVVSEKKGLMNAGIWPKKVPPISEML
jgi:hypothetical protein